MVKAGRHQGATQSSSGGWELEAHRQTNTCAPSKWQLAIMHSAGPHGRSSPHCSTRGITIIHHSPVLCSHLLCAVPVALLLQQAVQLGR